MCGFLCVFHAFLVCASVPVSSPFCHPCRPLHFSVPIRSVVPLRLPYFPCVHLLSSCIRFSCLGTSSFFYSLCPSLLSLFCVLLLTHTLHFLCVSFVPIPLPLCRPFCPSYLRPWAFRSPYACFQSRCPAFPVLFPLFPAAFSSSFSFVPAFSFPFSPLFSSPSFSI